MTATRTHTQTETMILVPWPRHPTRTATGRESRARDAGKCIPWLSANTVHRLDNPYRPPGARKGPPRSRVHDYKVQWRQAAAAQVDEGTEGTPFQPQAPAGRLSIEVQLYRNPANAMDPGAIVEGAKPLIDGLVKAGYLSNDTAREVEYDTRRSAVYPTPKSSERVVLVFRQAP